MKKLNYKTYFKYLLIVLSSLFLFQAITSIQTINVFAALQLLGLENNIEGLVLPIVYLMGLLLVLMFTSFYLRKISVMSSFILTNVLPRVISEYLMLFLVLVPTFITIIVFYGEIPEVDLSIFLNLYLFYYFLIRFLGMRQMERSPIPPDNE